MLTTAVVMALLLAGAWRHDSRPAAAPSSAPPARAVQDAGPSAAGSILDGVFSATQASRGQRVFQRACASCHSVSEHAGAKFGVRWAGTTMGELFDFLSTTMPDGDPGSLEAEEYASILAFFLKESGYKEGDKDLPSDKEALKKIRIEPLPK
jgi:mono/diheme cytochrome c family protein